MYLLLRNVDEKKTLRRKLPERRRRASVHIIYYIYIYILVWTRPYTCTEQSRAEYCGSEHSVAEPSTFEWRSRTAVSYRLFERTGDTEAASNSLFGRTGGTGQARTAFSSAFLSPFAPFCAFLIRNTQNTCVCMFLSPKSESSEKPQMALRARGTRPRTFV